MDIVEHTRSVVSPSLAVVGAMWSSCAVGTDITVTAAVGFVADIVAVVVIIALVDLVVVWVVVLLCAIKEDH